MSFLTPLYLLGLAAVSLPLLFHLIRRTPKGRYSFSSLMFLSPSPPRLTRRSRIDNWLLLVLRATALILLVAAFARPFLRSIGQLGISDIAGRKIAILVDTSASMQRAGLWNQVRHEVAEVLDDLGPGDDVALYRFGAKPEVLVTFDEVTATEPDRKIAQVQAALDALGPGWSASNLGDALVTVADEVDQLGNSVGRDTETIRQVVVISDLQEGARIDALRTYHWPDDVDLVVRSVTAVRGSNAGISLAEDSAPAAGNELGVRVRNSRDSQQEQFTLQWEDHMGPVADVEPVRVYTPSGESRVVRVPLPRADADRLVLTGDDHGFDNMLFTVPTKQAQLSLIYVGNDEAGQTGLRYYVERAFPETPHRKVQLTAYAPDEPISGDALEASNMVIVTGSLPEEQVAGLRQYLQNGGSVLFVLQDISAEPVLSGCLGHAISLAEVEPDDYTMFGQIDFAHPLFMPFSDPRYSDFTKIHFWRYRQIMLPDDWPGITLARFDTGDPLLLETPVEQGRLWILAAGWQPKDSDLSRSTKFVPLLAGMLERATVATIVEARYEVGDSVALPARRDSAASIQGPDGATFQIPRDTPSFDETIVPGIYTLALDGSTQRFAVNVPPDESRTDSLSADELEQRQVSLGQPVTRAALADKLRQMRDVELESRQKLWRWLIAAALAILILETWLAGRLTRLTVQPVETGR